jgi:tripartite-type tricarboxylate transporter receptor subunit TctC
MIKPINFLAAVLAFACTHTVFAQAYPSRNITLVVPYPAGGGTDVFARLISQKMATVLDKPIIVENRAGASGNIGAEAVARAVPDGHTLLYTASPIALSRITYPKLKFNPERDLEPVTMTVSIPLLLVVTKSLPAPDMKQFITLAKNRPNEILYSSGGAGSSGHFVMKLFTLSTGTTMTHVPYKGAAPALTALMTGEAQAAFLVPPVVESQLRSGRLRALAISTSKRSPAYPQLPTVTELGVPGFEALQWHGLFAPEKTPVNIIDILFKAASSALQDAEVKKRLNSEGGEVVGSNAATFSAFYRSELTKWKDVANRANLKFN